ncbi:NAP1-related protein 2 [Actinidia rufa]|uniref:NAP1-related protein 2 n=1 Tax=Actinidia rufa TaxID=165716 RepID=A0A7J0EAN8_9ERIC|nr:NAP1-related protein 2 [Actinidia rufa]
MQRLSVHAHYRVLFTNSRSLLFHVCFLQFLCHPALCDLLSEEDSKILKYLDSLHVEDFKDVKSGYSITFNFKPNPYFEDTKLTKSFMFFDEGTTKITGTNIKWKEGMGAANGVSHEKKGNKRPPTDDESFFSWFSESQQKDIAEGLNDEVAEIIKEDLWPNPLKYFNNEADEEDSDGDEDNEEGKGKGNGKVEGPTVQGRWDPLMFSFPFPFHFINSGSKVNISH